MSFNQKFKSSIANFYQAIKKPIVVPLIMLSMFTGAFGGSLVSFVATNFKTFADNILSTGYGCGTFGQSEPNYGVACTAATSITIPVSSSSVLSSSVVSSSLISSSVLSSSSNIALSSSAEVISSSNNIISSSSTVVNSSSQSAVSSSSLAVNFPPTLSLKVNLSGSFSQPLNAMRTNLKSNNLIPLSQPYYVAPFGYSGIESVSNQSQIPANAVDWVLVEVKNTSNQTLFTRAVFLLSDGSVVEPNSQSGNVIKLTNFTPASNLKVIVRHGSHLAVASNSNLVFANNNTTLVDLTKNVNVLGNNQDQVGTDNNNQPLYGMRKANVGGNGSIDAADRTRALNALESFLVYSPDDINLDGSIDAADRSIAISAPEAVENL